MKVTERLFKSLVRIDYDYGYELGFDGVGQDWEYALVDFRLKPSKFLAILANDQCSQENPEFNDSTNHQRYAFYYGFCECTRLKVDNIIIAQVIDKSAKDYGQIYPIQLSNAERKILYHQIRDQLKADGTSYRKLINLAKRLKELIVENHYVVIKQNSMIKIV